MHNSGHKSLNLINQENLFSGHFFEKWPNYWSTSSTGVISNYKILFFFNGVLVWYSEIISSVYYRSSHPEVFLWKDVLKICAKFTGEHACWSVISIKLLYWNRTSAWVFSCKFAAYFRNTFSWEHFWLAASDYFWILYFKLVFIKNFESSLQETYFLENLSVDAFIFKHFHTQEINL